MAWLKSAGRYERKFIRAARTPRSSFGWGVRFATVKHRISNTLGCGNKNTAFPCRVNSQTEYDVDYVTPILAEYAKESADPTHVPSKRGSGEECNLMR